MTTLREAAQMALDALENSSPKTVLIEKAIAQGGDSVEIIRSILKRHTDITEAIRAALAQPEQEIESDRPHAEDDGCPTEKAVLQRFWREHHAQPEREPIKHWSDCAVHNAPAYPAGKCDCGGFPVAWFDPKGIHLEFDIEDCFSFKEKEGWKPVYTAPPQREWVGLTDEEYEAIRAAGEFGKGSLRFKNIFNAIEAKLKEKNT